jgi:hypothetical protein
MSHTVPVSLETSHDPITRMRVFQIAMALVPDAYLDAKVLQAEPITAEIAGQLYAPFISGDYPVGAGPQNEVTVSLVSPRFSHVRVRTQSSIVNCC